jgi:hypothetical protein
MAVCVVSVRICTSGEKEISQRRGPWQDCSCSAGLGAVGFIDWLDAAHQSFEVGRRVRATTQTQFAAKVD